MYPEDNLAKYRVTRTGGAKIRQGYKLDSPEVGICPEHTTLLVSESRMVEVLTQY